MDLHTGIPYWLLRYGLLGTYPQLRQNITTDVAIIGAGISGALAAYELTQAGAEVVVLDRDDVASGSSAATSGLLLYDPDASLGDSCGFARRPSLYLASTRSAVRALRDEFEGRRRIGLQVEWLERRDIAKEYSFDAPAAIRSHGTGEVNCYRLTHRLLQAAANGGARVFDRTRITRVKAHGRGVLLDVAGGHQIRASLLVSASGYDAALKLRRRTGKLASTWVFVSEPLEKFSGWADRCLIWETARPYVYVRSTDDGRLMVGGEDEPGPETHENPRHFRRKIDRLLRRARTMFPQLDVDIAYAWAGTFATTGDGLPYIGSVPEYPHTLFALGYGGNGITFSVTAATLLRDAWLGRSNPDAGIFALDSLST